MRVSKNVMRDGKDDDTWRERERERLEGEMMDMIGGIELGGIIEGFSEFQ